MTTFTKARQFVRFLRREAALLLRPGQHLEQQTRAHGPCGDNREAAAAGDESPEIVPWQKARKIEIPWQRWRCHEGRRRREGSQVERRYESLTYATVVDGWLQYRSKLDEYVWCPPLMQ
jgi:hypothetical protein